MSFITKIMSLVKLAFAPAPMDPTIRFEQPCKSYDPSQDD